MARTLTIREADDLVAEVERSKKRAKTLKEKANEGMMQIVDATEISASAFTIGILDGRFGGVEVLGVPLSLGSALLMHTIAYAGVAPRHLHSFANGALAAYLNTLGSGVGARMAMDVRKAPATASGIY